VLSESPFLGVAWPTVSEDSPTTGLTRDELRRLIAVANDDGSRSAALITLLAINGLRITEAISRHVEHLTYDQGHRVLLLERKGGKRAKAPLSPAVVRALDGYLGDRASGPIFITASGKVSTAPPLGAWCAASPVRLASPRPTGSARTVPATRSPPERSTPAPRCETSKTPWATPIPARPAATTAPDTTSIAIPPTRSPPGWPRTSHPSAAGHCRHVRLA